MDRMVPARILHRHPLCKPPPHVPAHPTRFRPEILVPQLIRQRILHRIANSPDHTHRPTLATQVHHDHNEQHATRRHLEDRERQCDELVRRARSESYREPGEDKCAECSQGICRERFRTDRLDIRRYGFVRNQKVRKQHLKSQFEQCRRHAFALINRALDVSFWTKDIGLVGNERIMIFCKSFFFDKPSMSAVQTNPFPSIMLPSMYN